MSIPRSTHIFSARLEIVALMRDRVRLNGMCFRDSLLSRILGVPEHIILGRNFFDEIAIGSFSAETNVQ